VSRTSTAVPPHLELLQRELIAAAAGRTKRLIVTLPPRHGKSETSSHWFPTWFIGNFPDKRLLLCSYEASFAASWSRKVRDSLIDAVGLGVFSEGPRDDLGAANQWETPSGGGMISAGVGGSITGRGANGLIIDDPVKNAEEANSPTYREKTWEWYTTTAYTRLEPNGFVVLVQTRWHVDDLAGRILSPDYQSQQDIDAWRVINLPAFAEEGDPLGREPGEALWSERYPKDVLEQSRRVLGAYGFNALYQQSPTLREGGMFKREWCRIADAAPAGGTVFRMWDLAGTEGGGDWTAGVKVRAVNGTYCIEDVRHEQLSPHGVRNLVKLTADLDGRDCMVGIFQDPGQAGKEQAQEYAFLLSGYALKVVASSGNPDIRAMAAAAQFEAGNVKLLRGPWNGALVDELCAFQSKRANGIDDQVDALAGAFAELNDAQEETRTVHIDDLMPGYSPPRYGLA
jgi:predicted phage terminase large subunit-like protein